ncbi:TlpA family protein disulfide reductase [Propionibacteriaceae bacterium G1746]|uniref:TlpA family protein disulfide reductase n=1 Tax=Aestuariimicrobium sp. G57 TaxID=3418485 RepID=UPI003C1AC3A8
MPDSTPSRRAVVRIGLGLGSLAVLAGCQNNPSASSEIGFAQGDGSFTMIEPGKRKPAPVLTGTDLAGKPLTTSTYAGLVLVLNVWGSWCGPCRKEAPELVKAAQQKAGIAQFIGINTRDNSAGTATAFTRSFAIDYPNFYDPTGELLLQLRDLPPSAIPSTLVIDKQGRVAARILGETSASTLTGIIDDVAADS